MKIGTINYLLFSVTDLDKSIKFYEDIFDARLLVKGRKLAYFDLNGIWLALNVEDDIPRKEIQYSYTYIAFTVEIEDFDALEKKLEDLGVNILLGRKRDERDKKSVYFTDHDGHKFEFHTGSLQDRLSYCRDDKSYMIFF